MPFLIIAALALMLSLWYTQRQSPGIDISFFLTLATGAFTAFLGASIALWIYSDLSRDEQRRSWEHDLGLKYFEKIYAPLDEELGRTISSLQEYFGGYLSAFADVMRGPFRNSVDPEVVRELNEIQTKLLELNRLVQETMHEVPRLVHFAVAMFLRAKPQT